MSKRKKKGTALAEALTAWVSSNGGYNEAHKVRAAAMKASKYRLRGPIVQDLTTGRYLSWHGGESLDISPRVKVRVEGKTITVWRFRGNNHRAEEIKYENFHTAALDILAL